MLNQPYDYIVTVVDRSGSMDRMWNEGVRGYNDFIREQGDYGKALVTACFFDSEIAIPVRGEVISGYNGIATSRGKHYGSMYQDGWVHAYPRSTTALYDAIGTTIVAVHGDLREASHQPGRVIVCILTDGYENASKNWSADEVKLLVEMKREANWEFIFWALTSTHSLSGSSLASTLSTRQTLWQLARVSRRRTR